MSAPRRWDSLGLRAVGAALLVAGLLVIGAGQLTFHGTDLRQLFEQTWANVGTELIGIAITVLLIDNLNERRENERLRKELIRDVGSTDNGLALRALRELRVRNWLDNSLERADLSGADLSKANFEQVNLKGANLAGANLAHANLSRSKISGANFSAADLSHSNLEMSQAEDAIFYDANLSQSDMAYSCLKGANLSYAELKEADLTGADLGGADVGDADFSGSLLSGVSLAHLNFNANTVWPDGFEEP